MVRFQASVGISYGDRLEVPVFGTQGTLSASCTPSNDVFFLFLCLTSDVTPHPGWGLQAWLTPSLAVGVTSGSAPMIGSLPCEPSEYLPGPATSSPPSLPCSPPFIGKIQSQGPRDRNLETSACLINPILHALSWALSSHSLI